MALKVIAEKKTPSWRLPVSISLSSTESAIMDGIRISIATTAATIRITWTAMSGNRVGWPLAGSSPSRRRKTSSGPKEMANAASPRATRRLSNRSASGRTVTNASTADRNSPKVSNPISCVVNPQK